MISIKKDGRTIRTGRHYTEFRAEVFATQAGKCANPKCGRPTCLEEDLASDWSFHLNHLQGRGGGKRDDVMFRDGKQICRGECGACHRRFHHQECKGELQWSSHANR